MTNPSVLLITPGTEFFKAPIEPQKEESEWVAGLVVKEYSSMAQQIRDRREKDAEKRKQLWKQRGDSSPKKK